MTALDERPVAAAPAPIATDRDLSTFRIGMAAYIGTHRHAGHAANRTADPEAQRAGLAAVLADRDRHPTSTVQAGLQVTASVPECQGLQRSGWLLVGLGQHRLTGDVLYVLERAEQGSGS